MAEILDFLRSISGLLGSAGLAIAIAAWVRSRPDMRRAEVEVKKVELQGEAALWTEIHALRTEALRERELCDERIARIDERNEAALREMKGEMRVLRHERNNMRQALNMMFARIKRLPHAELSEIVAEVEQLMRAADEVIAIEKAALSALPGRTEG